MPVLPLPRLELSRFRGSRKSRAALVIIAIVPALYGGLFLSSNWNPTEHLDQLTAAVVNNDQPATDGDTAITAGKDLTDKLVESSSSGFTWKSVSAEAAHDGLEDGTYAATAVIPASFSTNITSVSGNSPEKAKITVTTNDATSYVLGQVTNSVATGIQNGVRSSTTKNYLDNVYVAFTDLHQQLTTAADGADKLADGAATAKTGSGELIVGLDQLTSGSVTLTTGAQNLASGAATAATGAATLATGLNTLRTQTAALPDQTAKLNTGAQDASAGAGSLSDGATKTAAGAGDVSDAATAVSDGAAEVASATGKISDGAVALASGTDGALTAAQQLQSGASTLVQSTPTLVSGAESVSAGLVNLRDNYASLSDAQRQAIIAQLAAGASQVSAGAAATNTGAQQLSTGLTQFVGTSKEDNSLSYLDAQTHSLADGATTTATGAKQTAAGAVKTADGAAQVATGTSDVATGAASLRTGLTSLADGTATLANKTPALTSGIDSAASGAADLSDGNTQLATGATNLAAGADTLSTGAQSATAGAGSLNAGIGKLQSGSQELASELSDGAQKVPSYSDSEKSTLATVASDPVTLDRKHTNAVAAYGEGLAPYFMPLALWIGGIVTYLILRALSARGIASTASAWRVALSGYLTGALFGVLQALILDAILVFLVGLESPYLGATVTFSVLVALVFTAIHQALVALFGSPGRLLALILLMLQLASAGGTYPVATAPGFFQAISPYLPMTYAVQGFRRLIAGGDIAGVGLDAGVLALFGIGFVLLSVLAVRRNRVWTIERLHPSLAL